MNKLLTGFAALMVMTATAAAEDYDANQPTAPNETYVIGAASIGGQRAIQASIQLEGGRSIQHSRTFVHGQITNGLSGDNGTYMQARIGIERRACAVREFFCAFGGGDLGYQHDQVDDTPWSLGGGSTAQPFLVDAHDLLIVPRAGVEMGRHIKARVAVELPFYRRLDTHMDSDPSDGGLGLALSAGLGYAF